MLKTHIKGDILLTRIQFRIEVFSRDKNTCVVCKNLAVDAHHIIDRKLWNDGGYYLDNGVSLCEVHHYDAEKSSISCKQLRELANIKNIILPDSFDSDCDYDKWGNKI